jgi:mono/diheme cytochrome c family protein
LLGLVGVASVLFVSTRDRIYRPPADAVPIPTDTGSIARGKHLVEAVAVCTICHGDDLAGKLAFDDPFLGHGYTANLTRGRGGIGNRYQAADWIRSIRYGVRPDGSGIAFMPSDHYNAISDADLGAMIAYLRSVPPVDNERTSVELNPWARLLIAAGLFGQVNRTALIDLSTPRTRAPRDAGEYLADVGGCSFCHGPGLAGSQGPEPGAPAAPNLTGDGSLRQWTLAEFITSMRNGLADDGHAINPKYMPWQGYRKMTDPELAAIWRFAGHQP